MIRLRCRQCSWATEIAPERVPRHGARVRCPECGGMQPVAPSRVLAADGLPKAPAQAAEAVAPVTERDLAPTRAEADHVLQLWLQELRRSHDGPLSTTSLFTDHGEELLHLFSLWKASYPGEPATAVFRDRLFAALAVIENAPPEEGAAPE